MRPFPASLLLATLVLLALLVPVRGRGALADLPVMLDPDEPIFTEPAIHMAAGNPMPPRLFGHPASLNNVVLAAVFRATFEGGRAAGWWGDWRDFTRRVGRAPTPLILVGRHVSALVGLYCVAALVLLAWRAGLGEVASLGAGALCGLSLSMLEYSRLVRPDVYLTLMVLLACHAALAVLQRGAPRDYLLAGVFCGLAAACRYPAAMALALVPAAHLLAGRALADWSDAPTDAARRRLTALVLGGAGAALVTLGVTWHHVWLEVPPFDQMPESWRDGAVFLKRQMRLAGAGLILIALIVPFRSAAARAALGIVWARRSWLAPLGAGAAFLAVTPDFLPKWDLAIQGLVWAAKSYHPRAVGEPGLGNLLWYLGNPLAADLGGPALALALAALAGAVARGTPAARLLTVFPLVYVGFMSMGMTRFARYAVPVVPFLALGAAAAPAWLAQRAPWPRAALLGGLFAIAALPASRAADAVTRFASPDARVVASAWIAAHVAPGTPILLEEHTGPLPPGFPKARQVFQLTDDPQFLERGRYDVIVTSSFVEGEPARAAAGARLAAERPVLARFADLRGPVVTVFGPHR